MRKKKCNPDSFGKSRTFGYPTDLTVFENDGGQNKRHLLGPQHDFTTVLLKALLRMGNEQGNPRSILIEREELAIKEEAQKLIASWLVEAMSRLPENQEACIFLRFRFDSLERPERLRTETEVAEIVGVSQSTVYRNIERGLSNLRKDYDLNLKDRINNIKA